MDAKYVQGITKKLSHQVNLELYESALELGSLLISGCYHSLVCSGSSEAMSDWSITNTDFCVDTFARIVLTQISKRLQSSSTQSDTLEQLRAFLDLLVVYCRALMGNLEHVRARVGTIVQYLI